MQSLYNRLIDVDLIKSVTRFDINAGEINESIKEFENIYAKSLIVPKKVTTQKIVQPIFSSTPIVKKTKMHPAILEMYLN